VQIGLRKAVELNTLGATLAARDALAIGLVNQVYPVEEFEQRVSEYLSQIARLSRPVLRLAKRATLGDAREQFLVRLAQVERAYLHDLMQLADVREGLAAFLEKRPPSWAHC
jgi:enoyl-CoA hydratase/carnithine racemase